MAAAHDDRMCLVSACYYLVWATVRWLQGTAYVVLSQEDVGVILEVFMDEGSRR